MSVIERCWFRICFFFTVTCTGLSISSILTHTPAEELARLCLHEACFWDLWLPTNQLELTKHFRWEVKCLNEPQTSPGATEKHLCDISVAIFHGCTEIASYIERWFPWFLLCCKRLNCFCSWRKPVSITDHSCIQYRVKERVQQQLLFIVNETWLCGRCASCRAQNFEKSRGKLGKAQLYANNHRTMCEQEPITVVLISVKTQVLTCLNILINYR